ncbi:MAG: right-handed parallel beta-helix repeat-containing protein, partial [Deltaproteobacteria bacterium]|nr:right-handed parallel beta-helix repeat-containing protein [Deltaproteobacteria bacterium]MBW2531439.1 right-handed parallel beta-helix repeat-containing protein [Deltaproteobacteria bacterium]
ETDLYVAPDGDDANPGTMAAPLATVEGARQALRDLKAGDGLPAGGMAVCLREGVYERTETFELGSEDSGTASSPIVWRAQAGEEVRFVGALALATSDFSAVTSGSNPGAWGRLDVAAQGQVQQLDLSTYTSDYGVMTSRTGGDNEAMELFHDGGVMQLARYPDFVEAADVDEDFTQIEVTGSGLSPDVSGTYVRAGDHNGRPYYQLTGQSWFIYFRPQNGVYYLGNTSALGGANTHAWWCGGGSYPFGLYHPDWGSPTGMPYAKAIRDTGFSEIQSTSDDTHFVYEGTRPERWTAAEEPMLMGYWEHLWDARHVELVAIDTSGKVLTITDHAYGTSAHRPYFAYNLLEEITQPGEYYVDRTTGTLYFWPREANLTGELRVSMMQQELWRLTDVSYVTLRGIVFEMSRGDLVRIDGGDHVTLERCTLKNAGGSGVRISGTSNGVERCTIAHVGEYGADVRGGDRETITAGGNFVRNSEIHHFGRLFWTYRSAVRLNDQSTVRHLASAGNVVEHNLLHHAPHAAVLLSGNEHRIENNEIHDVCEWASDAGAIYTGRDWGYRNNLIRHNFIHHIKSPLGPATHGIYLDDCVSGFTVHGNVLYRASPSSAILHGGGRDNIIVNNIIVKNGRGHHADTRGTTRIVHDGSSWDLLQKIVDMSYQQDPWASAYPELAAIPNDWNQLSGSHWLYPEGSVFSRNLGWQNTVWLNENGDDPFSHYAEVADNVEDADPMFVDEANLDLNLQPGSPALAIPGFEPIPFDDIGIQPP